MDYSNLYQAIYDEYGDATPLYSDFVEQKRREEEGEDKRRLVEKEEYLERRKKRRQEKIAEIKAKKSRF